MRRPCRKPTPLRGDLLLTMGRVEEAIPAFEAVIAAKPTDVGAYQNLISVLLRQNKVDLAQAKVTEMRKGPRRSPDGGPAVLHQSAQQQGEEAYDGVQQVLRVALTTSRLSCWRPPCNCSARISSQSPGKRQEGHRARPNLQMARRLLVTAYIGTREPSRASSAPAAAEGQGRGRRRAQPRRSGLCDER